MNRLTVSSLGFCLTGALTIGGCGGSEAPKIPLNQADRGTIGANEAATPGAMGGEAKAALDSGNMLFRAKAYERALAQYRRSARRAPTELAPLLGILMVADATKNAKLADSTLSRVRELNPAAADSAAAMSHAEILRAHPTFKRKARGPR